MNLIQRLVYQTIRCLFTSARSNTDGPNRSGWNGHPSVYCLLGCWLWICSLPFVGSGFTIGQDISQQQSEFFESKIRPVLVQHCYACHNSVDDPMGGLALDHRSATLSGGDGGPILVPGDVNASRLLAILRHQIDGLEMPEDGPKLEDSVIADFQRWIQMGAPDPRDVAPTAEELAAATAWPVTLELRKQWWSFQPIQTHQPPPITPRNSLSASNHAIDRWIEARINAAGLNPSPAAGGATLVRRLYVNLIGLPPSAEQSLLWTDKINSALPEHRDQVIALLVDQLLEHPGFGQRWARHWMDWIRYAESHGSEGDPVNDNAWHYRDYLIRALNADVPYDQLVREHIAGDLLPNPRINSQLKINESVIGTSHWRMVFHGFAPTDALDEKVRFTDDQINTFSKAFLGLTVSCARCHDHKFDAISQKDYYAMFGILGSPRPGRKLIDTDQVLNQNREQLQELKTQLRESLADDWLDSLTDLGTKIKSKLGIPIKTDRAISTELGRYRVPLKPGTDPVVDVVSSTKINADQERVGTNVTAGETFDVDLSKMDQPDHLLHFLQQIQLGMAEGQSFEQAWATPLESHQTRLAQQKTQQETQKLQQWNLAKDDNFGQWFAYGNALGDRPSRAGEFSISAGGDAAVVGVYPAGVYSHGLSQKHAARFTSPSFLIDNPSAQLWIQVIGDSEASVRYAVQNYPRDGTVYPVTRLSNQWRWQRFDVGYWQGDPLHIELATAKDAPLLVRDRPRSWFGIRKAMLVDAGHPSPTDQQEHFGPIVDLATTRSTQSLADLTGVVQTAIVQAIKDWKADDISDEQALLIDLCLRNGVLPNSIKQLSRSGRLVKQYQALEEEITIPTRVPGVDETAGEDQALMIRGDHKQLSQQVPRRFLEAIDDSPYVSQLSGRLQLAEDLLRDDNPLTRRVIVNRIWHHLFGQGIVSTPDNLGKLGQPPTHPELLDWLANDFSGKGWSIKKMIRTIVLTKTWQQSSIADPAHQDVDPQNFWLARSHVRRLEAEAIRDSMLAVSGQLRPRSGGTPVGDDDPSRSIYLRVIRNDLNPFLRTFDFPEPFSSVGRRDVTNVPAQSLTMMNDPMIKRFSRAWAGQILGQDPPKSDRQKVQQMFVQAVGRMPEATELEFAIDYLRQIETTAQRQVDQKAGMQMALANQQQELNSIMALVRNKLQANLKLDKSLQNNAPKPIRRWNFTSKSLQPGSPNQSEEISDQVTEVQLLGGATQESSGLHVHAGGYALTSEMDFDLKAKTLEAWVQLADLQQSGGGVISVLQAEGDQFDSIVYGERDPQQWMAGSNLFRRTKSLQGALESQVNRTIHMVLVYRDDGMILAYRDGQAYGTSYQSEGPVAFNKGQFRIGFGIRHLPAGENRMFNGKLIRAQLYDRALGPEEVANSFAAGIGVTDQQVFAALSQQQATESANLQALIAQNQIGLADLQEIPDRLVPEDVWGELAHAMFTLKEFIFVK